MRLSSYTVYNVYAYQRISFPEVGEVGKSLPSIEINCS